VRTDNNVCPIKMEQRKRIAIYGGTFDPVHAGHLEIARSVSELFVIDEFLFVPARAAPHKLTRAVSSSLHRYAMLALATKTDPRLCISTFELESAERQYTVDTLFHFRARFGESTDLFFVMGADSWAEITTWREWQRLITLANLIVVTRPGYDVSVEHVGAETGARIVDVRALTGGLGSQVSKSEAPKIFMTDAVMHDISATEVRQAARENREDLDNLVPLEVADYIRKYKLYRNTHEA
jgi:nicotinate-nucleotide adenylyltransferase